jgi:HSP20 family molecular chaperone IbpA
MSFFTRGLYGSDPSFTPLFRLLDEFDNYSREAQGNTNGRSRHRGRQHFQPKFDVCETDNAFELHGELPGIERDKVNIEFTDPQTMVVRGKVERTYTAGTSPHVEDVAMSGAITEKGDEQPKSPSHRATVEDEATSEAHESGVEEAGATKKLQKSQKSDKAKYWLTERSVGEFSRSFNFPTRVDQDAVSASFKDGILSVIVPKAKKHETRRIAVN